MYTETTEAGDPVSLIAYEACWDVVLHHGVFGVCWPQAEADELSHLLLQVVHLQLPSLLDTQAQLGTVQDITTSLVQTHIALSYHTQ